MSVPMNRGYRPFLSIVLLLASLFLSTWRVEAQTSNDDLIHDNGAWLVFLGQGNFASLYPALRNLRWWFDVQGRFIGDSEGYDQGLISPGIGYAIADKTTIWIGYTYLHTEPFGGKNFNEHRIWQQLIWSTKFEQIGLQSRTRMEQRFLETGSDTGWRLRQLFGVTYSFNFKNKLGLALYEELFLDLNDTDWGANTGFAQNRFFVGPSWKVDKKGRAIVEVGYRNQYIRNEVINNRMNHLLSINLLLNFN